MTHPILDSHPEAYIALRMEAHAELFDKLSKLRAFLGMLNTYGLEHFFTLDEVRKAEYLGTCSTWADEAFNALTVWDGANSQ